MHRLACWTVLLGVALTPGVAGQAASTRLSGRVVDARHAALGGVTVTVLADGEEELTVGSGEDGRFVVDVAATGAALARRTLVIEVDGLATLTVSLFAASLGVPSPARGELALGDLVMVPGVALVGMVRDPDGRPLEGVTVEATDVLAAQPALRVLLAGRTHAARAVSDARGRFVLRHALDSAVGLTAVRPGFEAVLAPCVVPGDPLVLTLAPIGVVRGRVIDPAGEPVVCDVAAEYEGGGVDKVPTDAGGRFLLPLTRGGRLRLSASAPGRVVPTEHRPILAGARDDVVLEMPAAPAPPPPAPPLRVRAVAAATGDAIPEFDAAVVWQAAAGEIAPALLDARLEARRRRAQGGDPLELPGPPSGLPSAGVLEVSAPGFGRRRRTIVGDRAALLEVVTVALPDEARITGRVVDARTGAPVPGCRVRATAVPEAGAGAAPVFETSNGAPAVPSAPDGSFEVRGLPGGTFRVEVDRPGRPAVDPVRVAVEAGGAATVVLPLPSGGTLDVRLEGAAVPPGHRVRLVPGDDRAEPRTRPVTAGGARFEGLATGSWRVELLHPALPRSAHESAVVLGSVDVAEGAVARSFDVSGALRGRVEGRVVVGGSAIPPARLGVLAAEDGALPATRTAALACVGRDGRYALPLRAGRYRLVAVDLATGVRFTAQPAAIAVEAGAVVAHDLRFEAAKLRIRLSAADDSGYLGDRLEILSGDAGPDGGRAAPFDSGVGLVLGPAARDHECWVPPGSVELRVFGVPLERREAPTATWPLGPAVAVTVQAVAGRVQDVGIEVPVWY